MKSHFNFTLRIAALILMVAGSTFVAGEFNGTCYEIPDFLSTDYEAPGIYNALNMTPAHCAAECGQLGQGYFLITEGFACFCGSGDPESEEYSVSSNCTVPCLGNTNDSCGGHNNLFFVGSSITLVPTFSVVTSPSVIQARTEPVNVSLDWLPNTKPSDAFFISVDFGDGSSSDAFSNVDVFQKTYGLPGRYIVTVYVAYAEAPNQIRMAERLVTVESNLVGFSMDCPVATSVGSDIICSVYLDETDFDMPSLFIDFGDSSQPANFTMPAPFTFSAGKPVHGYYTNINSQAQQEWLLRQTEFQYDGHLTGFELFVETGGDGLSLYVLSPECSGYCFQANDCSGCTDSASEHSCIQGFMYEKCGECADNETSCFGSPRHSTDGSIINYNVKYVISLGTLATGYWFESNLNLTDTFVTAGDVLALAQKGGAKIASIDATSPYNNDLQLPDGTLVADSVVTATGVTVSSSVHLIRAFASVPSMASVFHSYDSVNDYTVTATATGLTSVVEQAEISVMLAIENVAVVALSPEHVLQDEDFVVAIGEDFTYDLGITYQGGATSVEEDILVFVNWGDLRSLTHNTTSVSHTYWSVGHYTATFTVQNLASVQCTSIDVIVIERLGSLDLSVVPPFTSGVPTHESIPISITINEGSDYSCSWDMGIADETELVTNESQLLQNGFIIGNIYNDFVYSEAGHYVITVTCDNALLPDPTSVTLAVTAQDILEGLQLDKDYIVLGRPDPEVSWSIQSGTLTADGFVLLIDDVEFSGILKEDEFGMGAVHSLAALDASEVGVKLLKLDVENLVSNLSLVSNFSVEHEISVVSVKILDNETGEAITKAEVNVTVVQVEVSIEGSSVTIICDYGDNDLGVYQQVLGGLATSPVTFTHTYTLLGEFTIKVSVTNPIKNVEVASETIIVFTKVPELALVPAAPCSPFGCPFDDDTMTAQGVFNISAANPFPLDAVCNISCDLAVGNFIVQLCDNLTCTWDVTSKGSTKVVLVVVANDLNQEEANVSVNIDTAIIGARLIKPKKLHACRHKPFFIGVMIAEGNGVKAKCDFDEPADALNSVTAEQDIPAADDLQFPVLFQYTYATAVDAQHKITCTLYNSVQQVILQDTVWAHGKITDDFQMTAVNSPLNVQNGTMITFKLSFTGPTNEYPLTSTYLMDWQDGLVLLNHTIAGIVAANEVKTFEHNYGNAPLGRKVATMYVENLCNVLAFPVEVITYEPVSLTAAYLMYWPVFPVGLQHPFFGHGKEKNIFPLSREVCFYIEKTGTIFNYELHNDTQLLWTWNMGEFENINETFDNFCYKFSVVGAQNLTLKADSPDGMLTLPSLPVELQLAAGMLSCTDDDIITGSMEEKSFNCSVEVIASKMCMRVQPDANVKTYLYFADDVAYCIAHFSTTKQTDAPIAPQSIMQFSHIYNQNGDYKLVAEISNDVSYARQEMRFTVLSVNCHSPKVSIWNHGNPTTENPETPMLFDANSDIILVAMIEVNCVQTANDKSWSVFELDKNGNDAANISDKIKSVADAWNKTQLAIYAGSLKPGLYRIAATIVMSSSTIGIDPRVVIGRSTSIFVRVNEAPLVARVMEGQQSYIERSNSEGSNLLLNPGQFSIDLGLPESEPQGFVLFYYYCFNVYLQETLTPDPLSPTGFSLLNYPFIMTREEAELRRANNLDNGGCYTYGPGRLDCSETSGSCELPLEVFDLYNEYKLIVFACKESILNGNIRCGSTEMKVGIVSMPPPSIIVRCSGHIIEGIKSIGIGDQLFCDIDIAGNVIDVCSELFAVEGETNVNVTQELLENMDVSYTTKPLKISVRPGFFRNYTYAHYRLRVTIKLSDGSRGRSETNFAVIGAPSGGNCSITPDQGINGATEFELITGNWDTTPVTTKFLFRHLNETFITRLLTSCDGTLCTQSPIRTYLPQGLEDSDYYYNVFVQVLNEYGIPSELTHCGIVKVTPLQSLDGVSDQLLTALSNGDTKLIISLVQALASHVRNDVHTFGTLVATANLTDEEILAKRSKFADVVEVLTLATAAINPVDATSTEALLCALNTIAEVREATTTAQSMATDAMEKVVNRLTSLLDSDSLSPDDGDLALQNLVGAFSHQALVLNKNPTTPDAVHSEFKHAAVKSLTAYPTFDCNKYRSVEECNLKKAEYDRRQQTRKTNTEMHDKITSFFDRFMDKMVPGQVKAIEQPLFKVQLSVMTCDDIRANGLSNEVAGGTRAELPPSILDETGGCDASGLVKTQAHILYTEGGLWANNHDQVRNVASTQRIFLSGLAKGNLDVKNLTSPVKLTFNNDVPMPEVNVTNPVFKENRTMFYHTIKLTLRSCALLLQLELFNDTTEKVSFLVYMNRNSFPTFDNYEFVWLVEFDNTQGPVSMTVSRDEMGGKTGRIIVGIVQCATENEPAANIMRTVQITDKQSEKSFSKKVKNTFTYHYTYTFTTVSCAYLGEKGYEFDGLEVSSESTPEKIVCLSNHLTDFAAGFFVPPNDIDFEYVFSNLDIAKNPTIYATVIVIGVVFLIVGVWARRKDNKDAEKVGAAPMIDNHPNDTYYYEIIVFTGMSKASATNSKVNFILAGDYDETDVRLFDDNKRNIFQSGNIDSFVMAVPRPLGALNYIRIWHDNSGKGTYASWYLKYIIVNDLQTNEKFKFISDQWLAVEYGDGQVDRLLPVAGKEQMEEFSHLFQTQTRKDFQDDHLWVSVFARPSKSRFTRLQRVFCCCSLLSMTMMVSAMWYGLVPEGSVRSQGGIKIGPFSLTSQEIGVGFMANMIIFPINLFIVWLFRKSRPRKMRPSSVLKAIKMNQQHAKDARLPHAGSPVNPSPVDIDDKQVLTGLSQSASEDSPSILAQKRTHLHPQSAVSLDDGYRPQSEMSINGEMRPGSSMSSDSMIIDERYVLPKKKPRKKPFSLPWFCKYIAWFLLLITIGGSAFMTFLYGISFGDEKVQKWLTSLFVSFVVDVLITQPVKIFLLAVFFSCLCKKSDLDEDDAYYDEEEVTLEQNEEWLHQHNMYLAGPRKIAYKPPGKHELAEMREFRFKEMKMFEILREIAIYLFFLWIVWVVSYSQRDPNTYGTQLSLRNHFLAPGDWYLDFNKINKHTRFWNWTRRILPEAAVAKPWYNGQEALYHKGFLGDRVNRRLGPIYMRQIRVVPGSCSVSMYMEKVSPECSDWPILDTEETKNFSPGWMPHNNSGVVDEYTYRSSAEMASLPYWGRVGLYPGGGYYVFLKEELQELRDQVEKLEDETWIDKYTRAVFIEFSLYNPYVNLFTVGNILFEFPSTGGILPFARFDPIRLTEPLDYATLKIVCEVIFVLFIIGFGCREAFKFFKQKKEYFKDVWNYIEWAIIGFGIASIVLYFTRMILADFVIDSFQSSKGKNYINMQHINYVDEVLGYMMAFICFLATFKMIRMLRFNKRMSLLGMTLAYSGKDLIFFTSMFLIVFLAFTLVFMLILGPHLFEYATVLRSAETSFAMILNKFRFNEMQMASPVLAPIFFFIFVVLCTFILVNMFMTIIIAAFTYVRHDLSKQPNEYEMVDFIIRRFKTWTGIGSTKVAQMPKKELILDQTKFSHVEGMVNILPAKVDSLMEHINRIYSANDKSALKQQKFKPFSKAAKEPGGEVNLDVPDVRRRDASPSNIKCELDQLEDEIANL